MNKKILLSKLFILLTLVASGKLMAQTCPDDIVSYWNFNDATDQIFDDYVGSHDATSETSISTTAGKVGAAKLFSGTNFMNVETHADFNFGVNSSFTVETWVKYSNMSPGRNQVIIGKRDGSSTGPYWFLGIQNNTGKIIFEVQDANGVYKEVISPSGISTNVWHHIVGIRDEATNSNKLYVDGVMVAATVYDYTGNFSPSGAIFMGAYPNSTGIPAYFLEGSIDETVVYNVAISESAITEHLLKNNNGISYCEGFSPYIKSTPVTEAIVGREYTYAVIASGMPTMAYSLVSSPEGMVIDGATGVISWTPQSTLEDGWVVVRASNGVAPADTQSFRIFLAETPVCPNGISVLLKLNETSGSTYADYYVNHNSLPTVAPLPVPGIVNGAQSFNAGSKTGIDIPDNGGDFQWTQTDNFSFEYWMKTSTTGTMVIIGRHRKADDSPDAARWWVGTDATGLATFSLQDNAAVPKLFEISGGEPLTDNEWHHIIAVREGSAQINRLYVDGAKVAEVSTNYGNSFKTDVPTEISVGYWKRAYEAQNHYYFVGAIDEVAIFNKAINDAEALAFFNLGAPTGHCAIENFAPVITSTPITEATEDVEYSYTFTVEDPDIDLFTISSPTKPDWLNLNYTTGQKTAVLTGTPGDDNIGEHAVTLSITDGTAIRNQEFTITVANINDEPVITSTAILTGYVGNPYIYVFEATDDDINDELEYSAVAKPDWLTFDAPTGVLSGTPEQGDKGDHEVTLRVSDGTVTKDQTFTIAVDGPNALQELQISGVRIYPVPVREQLNISFENALEELQLRIFNISGTVVKESVIPANRLQYSLDVSNLPTGVYYLNLNNSTLNGISKFVITK